jgi:malyl-CoA/(S)-citramalyl-CoA lyase
MEKTYQIGNKSFVLDQTKAEAAFAAKRIINGRQTMTFNLLPLKYQWAYDLYRTMKANHWEPEDIPMNKDIEQWRHPDLLSDVERWIIMMGIGYFSAAEFSRLAAELVEGEVEHEGSPHPAGWRNFYRLTDYIGKAVDFGTTQFWTRVNSLDSPWCLDDLTEMVTEIGDRLDVIMVPKVEGPEDIHYVDRLLAQLEARAGLERPILVHALLETARGVANVEEICLASPRMQGLSLGPADLAADRRMKTTRVGGGHPGYLVRTDPVSDDLNEGRITAQQDLWHYTVARMVDACVANGIYAYYGPFGDIRDTVACEDQFRNAYLLGCVGAWSLHPVQIDIAKKVFSPPVEDVEHAKRVVEAMGDGTGAIMLDGKMEDDASVKQCLVVLDLAKQLAERDPELKEAYAL